MFIEKFLGFQRAYFEAVATNQTLHDDFFTMDRLLNEPSTVDLSECQKIYSRFITVNSENPLNTRSLNVFLNSLKLIWKHCDQLRKNLDQITRDTLTKKSSIEAKIQHVEEPSHTESYKSPELKITEISIVGSQTPLMHHSISLNLPVKTSEINNNQRELEELSDLKLNEELASKKFIAKNFFELLEELINTQNFRVAYDFISMLESKNIDPSLDVRSSIDSIQKIFFTITIHSDTNSPEELREEFYNAFQLVNRIGGIIQKISPDFFGSSQPKEYLATNANRFFIKCLEHSPPLTDLALFFSSLELIEKKEFRGLIKQAIKQIHTVEDLCLIKSAQFFDDAIFINILEEFFISSYNNVEKIKLIIEFFKESSISYPKFDAVFIDFSGKSDIDTIKYLKENFLFSQKTLDKAYKNAVKCKNFNTKAYLKPFASNKCTII